MNSVLPWVLFNAFVLGMLALDLGVFHKKDKAVSLKEALAWSAVWIAMALAFNAWIYYRMGQQAALEYLTGYLIEKSLSVDNIFVFVLLFSFFKIPDKYQHRVLFWGIFGALAMRGVFISVGAYLLAKFHWVMYVFGGFLIYTGYKMFSQPIEEKHPEDNFLVRWFVKRGRATKELHGHAFFVNVEGKRLATPLFLCLLSIEFTDLIFAIDSIPAIFAITDNTFIVYTSNAFAILGLRSLYFALGGIISRIPFLRYGIAVILVFIGIKMMLNDVYKIPIWISLAFISVTLAVSVLWSRVVTRKKLKKEAEEAMGKDDAEKHH